MKNHKQLIEERKALMAKAEELSLRELTPEDQAVLDSVIGKVRDIDARLATLENTVNEENAEPVDNAAEESAEPSATEETQRSQPQAAPANPPKVYYGPGIVKDLNDRRASQSSDLAFRGWALKPTGKVNEAHRSAARASGLSIETNVLSTSLMRGNPKTELRAPQASSPGSAGGFLIPRGFVASLEKAMLFYNDLRSIATVQRTATGGPLEYPTNDDTGNVGEIIGENTVYTEQDTTFGQVVLGAYKYTSKMVKCPIELIQDSAIDLPSFIGEALGERIARIQSAHFVTGTGTGQPKGIATAATVTTTGATTLAVSIDDLIDLTYKVDRSYRQSPNCGFLVNDKTMSMIRKLKDTTGQPVISLSGNYNAGEPDRLLGYPIYISNALEDVAVGKKCAIFGDLSKYLIRDSLDIQLIRMDERFAEYGQVCFVALMRTDANLLQPKAVAALVGK